MTHIDKHPAGSFCWIELATTDQKAAKDFYSSLFGWSPQDSPIGPSEFYTIFKLEGRDAAAGYTLREDQRAHGMPPNWMIYITVDSAGAEEYRHRDRGRCRIPLLGRSEHARRQARQRFLFRPIRMADHGR